MNGLRKSWVLSGFAVVIFVLATVLGRADEVDNKLKWMTDFEAALEVAEKEGKPVLANFSGSDWCGFCIRLEREVFEHEEFRRFAEEELVLLLIDFPRGKELSQDLQEQNLQLARRYEVRGFPTIILLDADGEELAQTGYRPGGVKKYVEHLKELLEDEDFEEDSSVINKPQPSCH